MRHLMRRREYERINQMLDDAIAGRFEESDYDESELSKLEVKWKRYLTSSKLSAQKVEAERTQVKELVTDISHQTRTPLANIQLYAQLLQEQELNDKSRGMVEEILTYSNKLEFLIEALVKTSRLESGVFQFLPREQSLSELAQKVCDAGAERAEAQQVIICPDATCDETVTAFFDEKWTTEAVGNILDNALKYSPVGSQVSVSLFAYEMFGGIEIADCGIGIPEDEIPRIFSRFYRGRNVHDQEGIGVGLYLARQIIEGQGGYIKVVSKPG